MPTFGGIVVPDELMPRADIPAAQRPGWGQLLADAAKQSYAQVRYGLPLEAETLNGSITPQDQQFYQEGLNAARGVGANPASVDDWMAGKVGVGRLIGENLIASLPSMVGMAAGGVAGGLAAGPYGALAGAIVGGTPQFVGSNVDRAVAENGVLTEEAAQRSLAVAPLQAGADAVIGRFLPGVGKFLGPLAARQEGGFIRRVATSALEAGATEAVTEAGQQAGERWAAGKPLDNAEAAKEYVDAAVIAFGMGGVLGAGGGLRRSPAASKEASQVTTQDALGAVDEALNGKSNAVPMLPAPADFIARPDGTTVVNPSGRTQLALPSPDMFPRTITDAEGNTGEAPVAPADVAVDAAGTAATGPNAIDTLLRQRQQQRSAAMTPELWALLNTGRPLTEDNLGTTAPNVLAQPSAPAAPLLESTALRNATGPIGANEGAPAVAPVEFARPLQGADLADLEKARKAKDAHPDLVAAIDTEIEARKQEDPFLGVRLNQDLAKLRDKSREEQQAAVLKLIEDGDTRAGTAEVARRLGLDTTRNGAALAETSLDATPGVPEVSKAAPAEIAPVETAPVAAITTPEAAPVATPEAAPVAAPITQETADTKLEPSAVEAPQGGVVTSQPAVGGEAVPTAPPVQRAVVADSSPADPEFVAEWAQIKRDAGIQRVSKTGKGVLDMVPANRTSAEGQVMTALAERDAFTAPEKDQVEKVARKLGLVTDDEHMDVTPKGRQAFLNTSQGLEAVVEAGMAQGYTGAKASIFERGVRDHINGVDETKLTGFDELAAYNEGKTWAKEFIQKGDVKTAARSQEIIAKNLGRDTTELPGQPQERAKRSPEELQRRSLNELVDKADMSGIADQEIVALRRQIAEGATPTEVGQAIQKLQGGESIRLQPESNSGVLLPRSDGRGQPRFKEIDQSATPAQKAQMRAETTEAVRAYDARNLIELARREGGLTDRQADKLHDLLDQGKLEQVEKALKRFDENAPAPKARSARLPTPPETVPAPDAIGRSLGANDQALEQAIDGKSFTEVLDHMVTTAPSKYYREVAKMVRALAVRMEKLGVPMHFFVVKPGDKVPSRLNNMGVRALATMLRQPHEIAVYVKGTEMGLDAGVNHQIILHEMLHAVTMASIREGLKLKNDSNLGRAVKDLNELRNAVISHFNERAKAGNLTPFEKEYFNRGNNSLANVDELLSWGMTNPDMQRYLASIEYTPKQSVFGKLVSLIGKLLGLDPKYNTALTELMRVSEQVLSPSQRDLAAVYAGDHAGGLDEGTLEAPAFETGSAGAANRTAAATNETTQKLGAVLDAAVSKISSKDLAVKTRRVVMGWMSHNQIDRQYGEQVPGTVMHTQAGQAREAFRSRIEQIGAEVLQQFDKLEKATPKAAEWVGKLMALSTEFQIDPDKAWEDHTHHGFEKDDKGNVTMRKGAEAEIARLKPLYDAAVKLKNDLRRGDGEGWKVYNELRSRNEAQNYMRMAVSLRGLIATDRELSLGIENSWVDPAAQFMREGDFETGAAIREYWEKSLDTQISSALAFITQKKGEAERSSPGDLQAMRQHLSPIELQINEIMRARQAMARAPYFHLGRFGDNFGSAEIALGADGKVDPAAQKAVAAALAAANLPQAQLSTDNTRPRFALRFETVDQEQVFRKLVAELEAKGLVTKDSAKSGPRTRADNFGVQDGAPQYVNTLIQNIEASPAFVPAENATPEEKAALAHQKEQMVQLMRDTWLESQPDSSISKVLVQRYTTPGYDPDMVRNWAHRWRIGGIHAANVSTMPLFNEAFTNMRAQYNEALQVSNDKDPHLVNDVMSELQMRDARTPINDLADTFDKLRGYAHSYFLGFSPAYGMINLTQLGVTALPELAKSHGYSKSFHAMRRASSVAMAVVKAVGAEAAKVGWKHWGDVAITETALKNAGLDEKTRAFVTHMLARGTIDIGSMARSLGRVADNKGVGGATDTYLKLSSSIGLYTETYSRLVTALAARELHGGYGEDAQSYAAKTVSESLFDYQSRNTARQLGKRGFLGPVTPILTQFMSYQAQMIEKLYSEVHDAFGAARPGESAESVAARKAASRKFLAGHLAAVTTLAGTLGLPFATMFATAIERLWGDEDEPFDATAAYRDFLASVFGKDIAEVVARGAPRALGFDISGRVGEQNLMPFSEFLSDRRSWREAVNNSAGRGLGAAPSMLINVLDGGSQMANGDLLGGMKALVPLAYKGPVEAYRMTQDGYMDTKGNKLPLSPTASSYLWQLLGFTPAEKAEYSEARMDQMVRRGALARRAGELRQGIVDGSQPVSSALAFDKANPAFAVMPSIASAIQRQETGHAQAVALQAPIGVSTNDIAGRRLTRYANVDYQQ